MSDKSQFEMLDIFGNRSRSGYEELVSYGPAWWTEYREMNANFIFAGWTIDLMALWLEKLVNNQFVRRCDEKSLAEFESILRIYLDGSESIIERKRTVGSYWSGTGKLSGTAIKELVKMYTGGESEVWWVGDELNIRIKSNEDVAYSVFRLINILERRMPSHIPFAIRNVLCSFELQEDFAEKVKYRIPICIRPGCFDGSMKFDGQHKFDNTPAERTQVTLRIVSKNEEPEYNLSEKYAFRTYGIPEEFGVAAERIRVQAIWWDRTETFDGDVQFDGAKSFNQKQPPRVQSLSYSAENRIAEEFTIAIFKASQAVKFDGAAAFDGTYKFNNGKEIV